MTRADSPGARAAGATFWLRLPSLLLLVIALLLASCGATETVDVTPWAPTVAATTPSAAVKDTARQTYQPVGERLTPVSPPDRATTAPAKRSAAGDLIPRVRLAELPVEATTTIDLILAGGPFPFERDGAVFHNFEQRLPAAGTGAYREYTVITPGSDDRGARRIVTNLTQTEFYYTDDHYESFSEIIIP
jgi:ribonuclease T1